MEERLQPYKNYYDAVRMLWGLWQDDAHDPIRLRDRRSRRPGLASVSACPIAYLGPVLREGGSFPIYVSSLEAMRENGIWSKIWFAVGGQYSGQYVTVVDRPAG